MLVFAFNFIKSMRSGRAAGNDPWEANTLEWWTTSPPPEHNFHDLPPIRSERPVFDARHPNIKHNGSSRRSARHTGHKERGSG